jgi:hypothetical protein
MKAPEPLALELSFTPPRTGSLPEKTGAELTARHRTYHTPYPGRLYAENIFV